MKRTSEALSGEIDDVVLQVVYGNSRQPPGDDKSSFKLLMTSEDDETFEDSLIGKSYLSESSHI